GNAAANLKLSKARADAVKRYLVRKGVNADQLITEGFGSRRPIADNKTAEGRQRNRRVEMKVIK
nr:OmpA family protein [Cytophagales bacterium]